ncbi:hypothetical protein H257_04282 [Aphanomyces astaci]|uniref:PHD-type domain-containing protein n=1 Tax=Aphanomyces astaci TaxID=112090 RepID=W4GX64_APHAT|nr:hypothetical protein H257_04282 [Aphanomyces astaci]ETV83584.1 hypothetical protein H257_04282 [Aphanomyces astaci]RQM30109.1 hypothetical protein B5M09_005899 [Aphanomyces astaci]|eukprot:XP_009827014.1 hypothetical protein H257_04282 [Aphanomyces astaci]
MDWDERRRLAQDIASLSSADLQGVLLRCHVAYPDRVVFRHDHPFKPVDWDLIKSSNWEGSSVVNLDDLDLALLHEIREYVDACYIPHPVARDQCEICCGLWSCGRVLACGNPACSTRIHEECFGMVLRKDPNGPWHCPSCVYGSPLQCCLCLQDRGGAIKPTSDGRWAHVICALGIPELTLRDVPTMEPVDGMSDIDPTRLRSMCNLCKRKGGAVVACEVDGCGTAFHISCAADAGLWIGAPADLSAVPPTPVAPFALYCEKHMPVDRIVGAKRFIAEEDLVLEALPSSTTTRSAVVLDAKLDDYSFVLDSASYLLEWHVWKERVVTTPPPPSCTVATTSPSNNRSQQYYSPFEVTPRLYSRGRFPVKTLVTDMVLKVASAESQLVQTTPSSAEPYPPPRPTNNHHGLPPFPEGPTLVGAIVEVYWLGYDDWFRAKVTDWDSSRRMNQVRYLGEPRMEWLSLRAGMCNVLHLPFDPPTKVKLKKYSFKGASPQYRPKPHAFASTD